LGACETEMAPFGGEDSIFYKFLHFFCPIGVAKCFLIV
jgi:hypothetical protein